MKKTVVRATGIAGVSISALAVAHGMSVAADGPQVHVNGDYVQGADFLKITYKLGEADTAIAWIKSAADGVDVTLKYGTNVVEHKHLAGVKYNELATQAYYKFIKQNEADFYLKFDSSSRAFDLLFSKADDQSIDIKLVEEKPTDLT